MAKFKVQGTDLIRVDNAEYPEDVRSPGETAGDKLQPGDIVGGTLEGVEVVDGEVILDVYGRIE